MKDHGILQVVPADPGNPVLCMTVAGPSDCGRAAFGGVGSLGGPNQNGGATSASGWLTDGESTHKQMLGPVVQVASLLMSWSPSAALQACCNLWFLTLGA